MLTHHVDTENHILEVTISGKINRDELSKTIDAISDPIKTWEEIRILKRVDSFSGMELKALVDDLKFGFDNFNNLKRIKKMALVTDLEWVEKLSEFTKHFVPGEFRLFESDDIEKARQWLR